jgi:hypothetical protein
MRYSKSAFSVKKSERQIFRYVLGITLFNIILFFIAGMTNAKYPGDSIGRSLSTQLFLMILGIVIGGFMSGLLVSLIPFRQLTFSEKYLGSSLIMMFALSVVFLMIIIRSLIVFSSS